jgi:hypothetical protein
MNKASKQLEMLWEDLLSRQPAPIKAAFASLDPSDQKAVLVHLQRMVNEPGWQPEQRLSAKTALDVLLSQPE